MCISDGADMDLSAADMDLSAELRAVLSATEVRLDLRRRLVRGLRLLQVLRLSRREALREVRQP